MAPTHDGSRGSHDGSRGSEGAKGAAGAATLSADGALDLIRHQHGMIRDLFDEVDRTTGEERRNAFDRLVRLLAVHETAEEEVLHPLARTTLPGGGEVADDRLAEENEAKRLLADLEHIGPDAPEFPARLDTLRLAVLRHARLEERYELPKLQRRAAPALAGAGPALRAAAAMAPTHPHPGGADSGIGNMVTGPFLAVADRVRDTMRKARGRHTSG